MATPDGQVQAVADRTGLSYEHARLIIDENLMLGDQITPYVKANHVEKYPMKNGFMVFYLPNR